jgi:uncharacterized membrane protein YgdD (TMEM256/DUF423 family)
MTRSARLIAMLAALHGALAVAIGAFAAHAIADPEAKRLLDLGARYEAIHALAALAAAFLAQRIRLGVIAGWLFVAGAGVFAWTVYGLAFDAPRWLGAVTPIGGVALILGWIVLAFAAWRAPAVSP